jgi:hypothetical protein
VDRQPTLLLANEETNDRGDRDWLSPMALQAKELLGGPCDAVADMGSSQGEEGQTCLDAGLPPSLARPRTSAHQKLGLFSKDDCT